MDRNKKIAVNIDIKKLVSLHDRGYEEAIITRSDVFPLGSKTLKKVLADEPYIIVNILDILHNLDESGVYNIDI